MPLFDYPSDKQTADKALYHFTDHATNIHYQAVFQEAVYILYGHDYRVNMDLNRRMNFFCIVCSKTMNSVQALTGHNNSANHLKGADRQVLSVPGYGVSSISKVVSRYAPDSIQHQIMLTNVKVVGVHLLEGYLVRPAAVASYYKCILCGAHGKQDAIYKHVIGDKHTDRFIKFSVEVKAASLTSEERNTLRHRLADRDGVDPNQIVMITEKELYPYMWEREAMPMFSMQFRNKNKRGPSPCSSSSSSSLRSSASSSFRRRNRSRSSSTDSSPERGTRLALQAPGAPAAAGGYSTYWKDATPAKEDPLDADVAEKVRRMLYGGGQQRSPDTSERGGSKLSKRSVEVQVSAHWAVQRLLGKLKLINHTQHLECAEVRGVDDVRAALSLLYTIGDLLQRVLRRQEQRTVLERDTVERNSLVTAIKLSNQMQEEVHYMAENSDCGPALQKCISMLASLHMR